MPKLCFLQFTQIDMFEELYDAREVWQSKASMHGLQSSQFEIDDLVLVECSITRYVHKGDRVGGSPSKGRPRGKEWLAVPFRVGLELISVALVHSAPKVMRDSVDENVRI